MYMRLLGYPAERVAILTTYNGQKHLIRDVIRKRCGENPMIGWPSKVCPHGQLQPQPTTPPPPLQPPPHH